MATQEIVPTPALGEPGEPCAGCGMPLAEDQRYCLNCGRRRGPARVPFRELARERRGVRVTEDVTPSGPAPLVPQPLVLVAAAASVLMVLLLGVGVLLGALLGGDDRPVAAAPPQVITVGSAGGGDAAADDAAAEDSTGDAGGAAVDAAFKEDWPRAKKGYTVRLQELPKDGTEPPEVAKAETAARAKGARGVGALDTDNYASLDAGAYMIYSGVYDDRAGAQKALAGLKGDFSKASVVRVDESATEKVDRDAFSGNKKSATVDRDALRKRENLSPEDAQKQSNKIPDQTKIEGKPPPKQKEKTTGFDTEIK